MSIDDGSERVSVEGKSIGERPPDYVSAVVTLLGWHSDLMGADGERSGSARCHVEKFRISV
jgi:hypothetical protein